MKQNLLFVWYVLIYSIRKLLSNSSKCHNDSVCRLEEHDTTSQYKHMVAMGKEQMGWPGIVITNMALMCICLPVFLFADWIVGATQSILLKLLVNIACILMMIRNFDVLPVRTSRNCLMFFYLIGSLMTSSYLTLTCFFLVFFENIV